MNSLLGTKKSQSQRFLENGMRIPVTLIDVKGNCIVAVKTQDRDHYQAVQLGFSMKKHATKAELGHAKGAKLEKAPKFLREVRIIDEAEALPEVGAILNADEVFTPGDIVDVSGFSKGKGFQGGVKRYGFHGGPKTHGQSDRHRAPGAVGSGTTPGRVYRGKRMAGNMGNDNVTIRNLEVIDVTADGVLVIKGLVPGIINGLIVVKKVGEDKNFVPLQKTPEQIEAEEKAKAEEESVRQAQEAELAAAAKLAEEQAKDPSTSSGQESEKAAAEAPAEEEKVEAADAVSEKTEEEVPAESKTEEATEEPSVEAKAEEVVSEQKEETVEEVKSEENKEEVAEDAK